MAAAREGAAAVTMTHFDEMRDKVMMGSVRTLAIQPEERHRLAVHEAGHTIVAHHLPEADPIYKVTIIPRGRSLGGTHLLPEEERHTLPESFLKARLAVMLGGRTSEQQSLGQRQFRGRRRYPPGDPAGPCHGRTVGHGRGGRPGRSAAGARSTRSSAARSRSLAASARRRHMKSTRPSPACCGRPRTSQPA